MELRLIIMALICLCIAQLAFAAEESFSFVTSSEQKRFVDLSKEFRCIVCPNQNLFDSNAESAREMRSEIYDLMRMGKTDADIKRALVEQYGEYVIYKPGFKITTSVLWLGPGLMLLIASIMALFTLKRFGVRTPPAFAGTLK